MLPICVLLLAGMALGQSEIKLPCEYASDLLRKPDGKVALLPSNEMKKRATHKQDVSGPIKQLDIKGTAIVDVLVASDGHVICTKSLIGHPMIQKAVEDALRQWNFTPADMNGRKVAYVGRMEFTLCNIMCGESGPSMTIVNDR
jgi:hypothetical protein